MICLFLVISSLEGRGESVTDTPADLEIPKLSDGEPGPGLRVRQTLEGRESDGLFHLLYLPRDWDPSKRYPVIFEYPGNRFREGKGIQEECVLGYGITGGEGAIWVCLPFVDTETKAHATQWWGNLEATVQYCRDAVEQVCEKYSGDREKLFLAGFSRGAIACNFVGLHDDAIASLWRGMICHSHYDGVRRWGYPGSDEASARSRLARLGGRPQWISHEFSVEGTRDYLMRVQPDGDFTFAVHPFREHTADWVLRDLPLRGQLRTWFREVAHDENSE